jgi:hypothetical protein
MHGRLSTFEVRVWNNGETQARRLGYPIRRVSLDAGVDAAAAQRVSQPSCPARLRGTRGGVQSRFGACKVRQPFA